MLRPVYGDVEAAQFGNSFQIKRRVNEVMQRAGGHSPSIYESLTTIPAELSVTRAGERYLFVRQTSHF